MEEKTGTEKSNKIRKVNIADFFTLENEEKGVWFEPVINGQPCGIEFKVTGAGTDKNVSNAERYEKKISEIKDKYHDPEEMNREIRKANAARVAEFVSGIRSAPGCEIEFDGKSVEYSDEMIQKIMYNSPLIANEILAYAVRAANFMTGKRAD